MSIKAQKSTFLQQLKGGIDVGYSFSSGNSQSSFSLDTNTSYLTPSWEASTSFDSSVNGQAGASKTNRQDVQATFTKFLGRDSFLEGYGHYLIRTTDTGLRWLGGSVYTHESFRTSSGQPIHQNAEALLGLQYHFSRFNFGELDSQLLVFPGLSDVGRVRTTTNNSVIIKLPNHFHYSVNFWDNFDSRPPSGAKRNELGVSSSIGWSR